MRCHAFNPPWLTWPTWPKLPPLPLPQPPPIISDSARRNASPFEAKVTGNPKTGTGALLLYLSRACLSSVPILSSFPSPGVLVRNRFSSLQASGQARGPRAGEPVGSWRSEPPISIQGPASMMSPSSARSNVSLLVRRLLHANGTILSSQKTWTPLGVGANRGI